ncbi:hypothetical protein [Merismopedia glauca]|uniref:DUF2808 domain-containing protein n=1 Tax=Merismopedia glauca CCAP 1448/3 TaxID=1296344 RepID=A0A2T1C1G5_9CYAN|nr:hypothetical protein [Merismopedia glauca]PSB02125.1 hypothetical protein C7B64_14705 [Merismopedia glauca CCAP 1448/3]
MEIKKLVLSGLILSFASILPAQALPEVNPNLTLPPINNNPINPNVDLTQFTNNVKITAANLTNPVTCNPGGEADCFDVKWNLNTANSVRVVKIVVILKVTRADGSVVTATKELSPSARQLFIGTPQFNLPGQQLKNFEVTLNVFGSTQPNRPAGVIASDKFNG